MTGQKHNNTQQGLCHLNNTPPCYRSNTNMFFKINVLCIHTVPGIHQLYFILVYSHILNIFTNNYILIIKTFYNFFSSLFLDSFIVFNYTLVPCFSCSILLIYFYNHILLDVRHRRLNQQTSFNLKWSSNKLEGKLIF